MIENIHNPFFEATRSVFNLMLDLQDVTETTAENFNYDDGIGICIGVVGDLTGKVNYKFPDQTSLSMVNIISGMEIDSVDEFVTSAVSEIANIISGNVLNMLSEININCDILPPAPADSDDGNEYEINNDICVTTSIGNVCLNIRLNKGDK